MVVIEVQPSTATATVAFNRGPGNIRFYTAYLLVHNATAEMSQMVLALKIFKFMSLYFQSNWLLSQSMLNTA